jgi:hypothetical protein
MQMGKQPIHHAAVIPVTPRQRLWAVSIFLATAGLFTWLYLAQRMGYEVGSLFGPCEFKQRYGLPCPTCGMTTAVLAFTRGEIATAFCVQPAAGVLLSALVVAACVSLAVAIRAAYPPSIERIRGQLRITHVLVGLGLVLAAGWAVTFLRAVWG